MDSGDQAMITGHLQTYVILGLLLRKRLVSLVDVQEQIDLLRKEIPEDHEFHAFFMRQLDIMEQMDPQRAQTSPLQPNDDLVERFL